MSDTETDFSPGVTRLRAGPARWLRVSPQTLLEDQRFRFLIAGGSAAAVNWFARMPLGLFMPYWSSIVISQAIGMAYGFVVFRAWVFSGFERRSVFLQIRDFLLVNFAGAATTIGVAIPLRGLLLAVFGTSIMIDPAAHAAGIAAGAIVNFLGHRQYTFRASA